MNSIGTWIPIIAQAVSSRLLPVWGIRVWGAESQSSHIHRGQVKQLAPIAIPQIEWGGKAKRNMEFYTLDQKGVGRVKSDSIGVSWKGSLGLTRSFQGFYSRFVRRGGSIALRCTMSDQGC